MWRRCCKDGDFVRRNNTHDVLTGHFIYHIIFSLKRFHDFINRKTIIFRIKCGTQWYMEMQDIR